MMQTDVVKSRRSVVNDEELTVRVGPVDLCGGHGCVSSLISQGDDEDLTAGAKPLSFGARAPSPASFEAPEDEELSVTAGSQRGVQSCNYTALCLAS